MRAWSRVVLTTIVVAVLPVATVWALWILGVVTSVWVAALLAVALVFLASLAGSAYWKRRPATGDVLFRDLLLWGWLRRARAKHQLADAVELLKRVGAEDEAEKLRLLRLLAQALDAKDPYLDGHSHRVARFSSLMARRLGVPHDEAVRIRTAAAIHDVGKLHVPAELLSKPDKLTGSETEIVHRHADEGAGMVACLGDPALSAIVRHHHERFDGTGYPGGLRHEAIPLGARIVAVADTFDAITSARPYRPAGTHKHALDVLAAEAGTQLDPVVVRAFVKDYAGRRGLALWALLAMPLGKARRPPLPVGAVLAGVVLVGAAATAVQIGGSESAGDAAAPGRPPAAGAAPAATAQKAPDRPARRRKVRERTHRAALSSPPAPRATPGPTLVAANTRPPAATRPRAADPPRTSPRRRAATPPRATPPPKATPHPAAPPQQAATPPTQTPVTAPPASTPPPATTPSTPTPTSPSGPTSKDQCKGSGYASYGFSNQGQCIASLNGP